MTARKLIAFTVNMSLGVLTFIGLSLAQNKGSASTPSNVENEIRNLAKQWYAAFDKGDGATMDQMEVPNLILINSDGKGGIWRKDGLRAGVLKPGGQTITMGQAEVRQFGNTAILTGPVSLKNSNMTYDSNQTMVWVRENNKWKIVSAQWSQVTP